VFVG
jgi:20S proteasome subunit alpha 3